MNTLTETGRKTFLWYRVYCGMLALLYLAVVVLGIGLVVMKPESREYSKEQLFVMGVIYAAIGAVFFVISMIALLLPARPFNWIIGIMMIALGLSSCLLWPICIPLLIYWFKPETKEFFGRT